VSKPEWGVKRTCQSCAARFYDLKRAPIVCPKCGHKHDAEDFIKTRRTRGAAKPAPAPKKIVEKVVPELDAIEDVAPDDDTDDDIIEDTADLGEDADDIPDVIETDTDETTN